MTIFTNQIYIHSLHAYVLLIMVIILIRYSYVQIAYPNVMSEAADIIMRMKMRDRFPTYKEMIETNIPNW